MPLCIDGIQFGGELLALCLECALLGLQLKPLRIQGRDFLFDRRRVRSLSRALAGKVDSLPVGLVKGSREEFALRVELQALLFE